jgi:hypothetical protein
MNPGKNREGYPVNPMLRTPEVMRRTVTPDVRGVTGEVTRVLRSCFFRRRKRFDEKQTISG